MRRSFLVWRCFLAVPGIALLLMSALLLGNSVFASWRFILGLTFHLAGQACCMATLCLPVWLREQQIRRSAGSSSLSSLDSSGIRVAHFRPEIQVLRLLCGIGYGVFLLGWLVVGALGLRDLIRLRTSGVTTQAAITGTSFREKGGLLTVTYAFAVPNRLPVTDTFQAPRASLPTLRTGNLVPIAYVPTDPGVHTWERVNRDFMVRHCLAGAVTFAALAAYTALPLLWVERRLRRQLRLARMGVGVTGTIVICKPLLWRKKRRGYWLTYVFSTPNRHVFFGRALVPYVADEPTLPGFPLTILYNPQNPAICLPLAAFHVVDMPHVRKSVLAA